MGPDRNVTTKRLLEGKDPRDMLHLIYDLSDGTSERVMGQTEYDIALKREKPPRRRDRPEEDFGRMPPIGPFMDSFALDELIPPGFDRESFKKGFQLCRDMRK
ncbi:hypothetical protein VCUG_01826 [Vavraia culicis subsp. floridensis]|uniref:Uncharacterized protein n=1 Tax=Vavraia culicis (isolate floridensis) TaxID=948595 RepID=L2GSM9_VAVCU|nr:uncharacterized protein VCUG_01826 [Vavraia culicis subsp. floridensis]ELA46676.1 hypothetical protein VCUG_01826 [Vavraia culicis subsp. floridensis]